MSGFTGAKSCVCILGTVILTLDSAIPPASYSFTISNMSNPPSGDTVSTFQIKTKSGGYYLEKKTLSLTMAQPAVLTITYIRSISNIVSTNTTHTLVFKLKAPIFSSHRIIISFSDAFTINKYTNISSGIILSTNKIDSTINGNQITLISGIKAYFDEDFACDISIKYIMNPYSEETATVNITVITSEDKLVANTSTSFSFKSSAGNFSSISIVASDSTIYTTTSYQITMNLDQIVKSNSYIVITFPSEISVANQTKQNCSGLTNLLASSKCEITSSKVKITECFTDGFKGLISFSVSSVSNPTTTSPSSVFILEAYTDKNDKILYNNTEKFIATPGSLNSTFIDYDSKITGDTTTYKLEFTTSHKISAGGIISITFPRSTSLNLITCSEPQNLHSLLKCSYSLNNLTITDGFKTDLTSGNKVSIKISGIKNPGTTEPSSSVEIYSRYNGYIIDQATSGLSIVMTTPNIFKVELATNSTVIGGLINIEFKITPFNPMINGGTIKVYFPDTMNMPTNPNCEQGIAVTGVSCVNTSDYIEATLSWPNSSSSLSSLFSFKIKNCKNPGSSMESSSFALYSFDRNYSIDKIESGVTIQANSAGLLNFSISLDDYGISEITKYTFNVTPSNPIPDLGYIEIYFDNSTLLNENLNCPGADLCERINSSAAKVSFSDYKNSTFSFSILYIQNPKFMNESYFINMTSMNSSYLIDSGSKTVNYACHSNCSTCEETADKCVTCLESFPYLYNERCYKNCPSGTTSYSTHTCTDCTDSCLECTGTTSTCTKCESPLVLLSSKCEPECGEGKFNNSGTCTSCINNCEVCPNSTYCLNCSKNYLLYNGDCVSTCPPVTLKTSNTTCEDCKNNCKTCKDDLDFCISCKENYSLYENKCLSECPSGTTSIDGKCETCDRLCLNCSGKINQCTACYESLFLYKKSCYNDCPDGSVTAGDKCEDCGDLCSLCEVVSENCTECVENATLYGNKCFDVCPNGTVDVGDKCQDCNEHCKTCFGSVENCTICEDGFYFYENTCLEVCPDNVSIVVGSFCEPCEPSCATCDSTPSNCTSCNSSSSLYNSTCLSECPEGYISNNSECSLYYCVAGCNYFQMTDSNCDEACNVAECNYDNDECTTTSIPALQKAPLPFTLVGVGSSGIMLGSKLLFPATSLTSSVIAVWGVFETGSWLCVLNEIAATESKGRRLLSDDSKIQLAFILLLVFFVGHLVINTLFGIIYFCVILKNDYTYKFWSSGKKMVKWGVVPLALLVNFKFMRIMDSKLFGCSCLDASYDKKSNLYKPLVWFTYISIIFTILPTLGSLIFVLVVFDSDSMVFALALDSLIITVCQLILNIYDIVILSLMINKMTNQNKQVKSVSISPQGELMNTQQFTIYNTKGEDTERPFELDMTGKVFPEPEDEKESKESKELNSQEKYLNRTETQDHIIFDPVPEIRQERPKQYPPTSARPDMWNISFENFSPVKPKPAPRILDIINEENDLDLSTAQYDEGSTIIANHIPSGRKVLISKTFKDSFNLEDPDKLFIDFDKYVLENVDPENIKVATLRDKTMGTSIKVGRNFNQAQIIDVEENGQWTIGKTVKKEEDFDFAHAFQDPDDPEAVVVWNKVGKVYTIVKKDFKGVPKLDPKSNLPLFNERMVSNYDPRSLQIDQRNVHFGNLICDGEKVRVRRNFIGGKILEVIDKDKYLDKKIRKANIQDEPEVELKAEELDDLEPEIIIPSEPIKKVKKTKKKNKHKNWDNIEAIYLQRLEPSIKLKRPKPEPNNFLNKMIDEAKGQIEMKILEDSPPSTPISHPSNPSPHDS